MTDVYASITHANPDYVEQLGDILELRAAQSSQKEMLNEYLSRIEFPSDARVLEVGCGTGAVARQLAALPSVCHVVGLDPSPILLAQASRLGEGVPNLSFQEGDGRDLPFEDGTFDVVVFHTTLCHIPGPERALREAHRVLIPSGWLAVFDGDYATTTVAVRPNDPLQTCVDRAIQGLVLDPWLLRRLPELVRQGGFGGPTVAGYSFIETDTPEYMLTIVDRGADFLVADGRLDRDEAAALKLRARDRAAAGRFFGHIAFGCVVVQTPASSGWRTGSATIREVADPPRGGVESDELG